ncbi:MAG: DUF1349 domain-containing protein, partial [Bacteroidota bacterium]
MKRRLTSVMRFMGLAVLLSGTALGQSTIVSDDFNRTSLNTSIWTYTDPRGDATMSITGAGTTNARFTVSLPAGVSHDVWAGDNTAPRIMQSANDTDFELEVKFEAGMSSAFQGQGVLVQQDADNFIRFDFYSNGLGTRLFSASFVSGTPTVRVDSNIAANGTSPLWLRVKRETNDWTQSYSTDGSTFTSMPVYSHTLTVSSVGVFIGNSANPGTSPPAF